jgi:hypothetical protein
MDFAKRDPTVENRVNQKKKRRQCLVQGCREEMVCRGCCRAHYDAAAAIIASQPTAEGQANACETLINEGLLLPKGEQPRRIRPDSKAVVFRQALRKRTA